MLKLSSAVLSSVLFLYAAGTYAAVQPHQSPGNSSAEHVQGHTLKSKATKVTKKNAKKKAVRKARKKAVHTLVK